MSHRWLGSTVDTRERLNGPDKLSFKICIFLQNECRSDVNVENLGPKSLFLFGHCVLRSFVFMHIPASNVFIYFYAAPRPSRGPVLSVPDLSLP